MLKEWNSFVFKQGVKKDIPLLEPLRLASIENCKGYTCNQLAVWKRANPNWNHIISKTIVCYCDDATVAFVSVEKNKLHLLYVDPFFQRKGIGNQLISLVEVTGMECDANLNTEKLLIKRGWIFSSNNIKKISGETFYNKCYMFNCLS